MGTLDDQAARLEAATGAILALQARVTAAGPWPLAAHYDSEAEANWGPLELLAHVDEALPFWLGEVERILEGSPAAAVPFGRAPDDTLRAAIIGRDRTVPLRELFARLGADGRRVATRMRELSAAEAGRLGLHPVRGEFTIAALFERFLTSHVEGHVDQLREILATRGA